MSNLIFNHKSYDFSRGAVWHLRAVEGRHIFHATLADPDTGFTVREVELSADEVGKMGGDDLVIRARAGTVTMDLVR
jgi:hypothetical protein